MSQGIINFETGSATHTGVVRQVNEDSLFVGDGNGVWLVADGMGGHHNGKLASSTIVEAAKTVGRAASAPDLLARFNDRVYRANAELLRLSTGDENAVMGSTLAALLVFGQRYACVWSGDSRVYLVRNQKIVQISHDHSEVQELIDKGLLNSSEARSWPGRNVVTRAVGVFEEPELEAVNGEIEPADVFVLCSDGLTGHVEDSEILSQVIAKPPQSACDDLVELTLQRGAKDNVTVVVVSCQPGPMP